MRNGQSSLTAEVEVLTTLPAYGPLLLGPKRLDLLAEQTQHSWARHLASRCDAVMDWDGILTEACRSVIKKHREGEPSVRLGDIVRPDEGSWLLPGLILSRMPVVWFGDGSAGKSLLALAACEAIQRGDRTLLGVEPTRRTNVLWLDWEFDAWEHKVRSHAITGDNSDIRYRRMSGALHEQVEALEREIDEHSIGLMVCDSAAYACGGKPEDSEQTNLFFEGIRALNVGALIIAHETKTQPGSESKHDKPFGSVFWHNAARSTWFVQKQQDESEEGARKVSIHAGMFNRKSNKGKLWNPIGYRIEIINEDDGEMALCGFIREDVRDVEGLRQNASKRSQIIHALRGGSYTAKELAAELEAKENTIIQTLTRMKRQQEVVSLPESRWGLIAR